MIHDPDPTGFGRPSTADGLPSTAAQGRTHGHSRQRPARPSPDRGFWHGVFNALAITAAALVVIGGFVGMAIAAAHELGWLS